jgi:hypothetical protein
MPEFAVDFHLPGIGGLPDARVQELNRAFGLALDGASPGVRWVGSRVSLNTLRCILAAPHETAIYDAALHAHLPPDRVCAVWAVPQTDDLEDDEDSAAADVA